MYLIITIIGIAAIIGFISEILFWLFIWEYDTTTLVDVEDFELTLN